MKFKHKLVGVIFGIVIFSLLYFLLVVSVADNNIWIYVMMSGAGFVTWSLANIIAISILSGILISMLFFKFDQYRKLENKGFFGFIGFGIGAFGVGCPTCGAFLFAFIGMPLALTYLPFKGLELQTLSVVILAFSVYLTRKSMKNVCYIKKGKLKGGLKNV